MRRIIRDLLLKLNLAESLDVRMCDSCLKKFINFLIPSEICVPGCSRDIEINAFIENSENTESDNPGSSPGSSIYVRDVGILELNKGLVAIGETPIKKSKNI